MNSLLNFVIHGKFGPLFLGIPKKRVLDQLCDPKDWLGRKTIIGGKKEFFHQSDLWFYYEGAVGVRFGKTDNAEEIIIYPKNAAKRPDLFTDWPTMKGLRMGQWREALQLSGIPFRESSGKTLNYWIVAGNTCVTCCFPLPEETETSLNGDHRIVEMLQKYVTIEAMERDSAYIKVS